MSALSSDTVNSQLKNGSTVLVPLIVRCLEKALIDFTDTSSGHYYYGESAAKNTALLKLLNQCVSWACTIRDSDVNSKARNSLIDLLIQYIDKFIGNPHVIPKFLETSFAVKQIKKGNKSMVSLLLTSYKKLNINEYNITQPQAALKSVFYKLFSIEKDAVRQQSLTTVVDILKFTPANYLKVLIADAEVIKSIRSGSPLQLLCERYLATLTSNTPKPEHPWRMPAQVYNYPQVEAFLRSDQQSMTIQSGFRGIVEVRNFINRVIGNLNGTGLVSVQCTAGGTGARAYCILTKTNQAFEFRCNQYKQSIAERTRLQELLAVARSASANSVIDIDTKPTSSSSSGSGSSSNLGPVKDISASSTIGKEVGSNLSMNKVNTDLIVSSSTTASASELNENENVKDVKEEPAMKRQKYTPSKASDVIDLCDLDD